MSLRDQLEETRARWRERERISTLEDERCALDFAQRLLLLCADRRCLPRMDGTREDELKVVLPAGVHRGPVTTSTLGGLVIETAHTCGTGMAAVELLRLAASYTMASPGWWLHFLGLVIDLLDVEAEGDRE